MSNSNTDILNQKPVITITRVRRVNAIVNQETEMQVPAELWRKAVEKHAGNTENALLELQCNQTDIIIKSDSIDIDEVNATFENEVFDS